MKSPHPRTRQRRGLRSLLTVVAAVGVSTAIAAPAFAGGNTNSVAFWCGSNDLGTKVEPVGDPFVVPDVAPAGHHLTLLVLKAGSGPGENVTFANPVVGQGYSHNPEQTPANSHAILCWDPDVPDTTEPPTETTEPPTETTDPPTETTEPPTETTDPPVTPTTQVGGDRGPRTTQPAATLPATGSTSGPVVLTAAGLFLGGTAVLLASRRRATI